MNKSEYRNVVRTDPVDQSVRFDQQLTYSLVAELGNDLPSFGELGKRGGSSLHLLHEGGCVGDRISGDVICGGFQVVPGRIRPDYLPSHRAIRRSASACEITLPSASASSPF